MRKETLLNDKQTFMKVSLLGGIGLAMLFGSATVSLAQQDNKGSSSKCSCVCFVDTGAVGSSSSSYVSTATYDSNGISCGAFNNKTCNIDIPGVGIRSGRLDGCRTASTSTGAGRGITILPHGSATLATTDSKPPKTTTPKAPVTGTTTQRK